MKSLLKHIHVVIMRRLGGWLALGLATSACTNYSSEQQTLNTPILLGVTVEAPGHLIQISAQNVEIGFSGYRMFTGATAAEAQAATSGVDCGALSLTPNQSTFLFIEVKPNQNVVTPGASNRLCAVPAQLTSGQFVVIRALLFNALTISTGLPSNAAQVP
jgi:hypothetical protein